MSGKPLKEVLPKNAQEIWAAYMRQKAAMESQERCHLKVVAEMKEKHAAAISELVDGISGDLDSAVKAVRNGIELERTPRASAFVPSSSPSSAPRARKFKSNRINHL